MNTRWWTLIQREKGDLSIDGGSTIKGLDPADALDRLE
jgi:hypothetical protein